MIDHMLIMVTGGRTFRNRRAVADALRPYATVGNVLIAGGAEGADSLAQHVWCKTFQLPAVTVPARWDEFGKGAGHIRNQTMVAGKSLEPYVSLIPDVVVAFPGGTGTANAIEHAERAGIPVVHVDA